MNTYQDGFRSEILNTMFNLAGKIWLKVTGVQAIQFIIMLVVISVVFLTFGLSGIMSAFGDISDITSVMTAYTELFENIVSSPTFILLGIVAVIILLLIGSWVYYFSFLLADKQIKEDKADFAYIFNASFSKGVFKTFGIILLLYLFMTVLMVFTFIIGAISVVLGVLTGLIMLVLFNKATLILPAAINGKMTLSDAIAFSFKNMTFGRCAKLFLIMILFALGILIVAMVIGLVSMVFNFIPIFGQLIQFAIQIFFSGFIMALTVSGLSGLYYRYADDIQKKDLDIDNLIISDNS